MDIQRKDINYNFLKRIIIRMDYNGILEMELEKTIEETKRVLKEYEFDRFNEGLINEVDFEIKDPEKIETQQMISVNELRRTKSFIFNKSNNGIKVEINKFFMYVAVDYNKYIQFEDLSNLFNELFTIIKKNNNYMRVLRLGLRKINNCILLDINRINDIVKERYLSTIDTLFDNRVELYNKQNIDTFSCDDININLIRYLSSGVLERDGKEQQAYQLAIDIDSYSNDEYYLKDIVDRYNVKETLIKYNSFLFKTYINMLNDSFVSNTLIKGKIDESLLIGVVKND